MEEFRIAKETLEIALTLAGGEEMHGRLFIQTVAYLHDGREWPADLLNAPEPFFPFAHENGEILLLAKDHVAEVLADAPEEDEILREAAMMALVEVTLSGGVSRFGSMRLDVRPDHPRLLDHLNGATSRFLTLYTDRGVRLLNRAMIRRVRPLD